ncbi:MAG: oligosaccharide flippase family protein, partial [Ardenticatenaceae bacterium]|nr:oligosaccharide flippase family protein [Ardenticatenaceae bacterium]
MNQTGRTIAKNASVLFISQITTWGLSLVIIILLSRYLGAAGVGQIHLANSIWAIMAMVMEFGMNTHLTKEISRDPGRANKLVSVSLVLRFFLFLVSALVVLIYLQFAGYAPQTVAVIIVTGFAVFLSETGATYGAALKGLERMEYTSLAEIVARLFTTFVIIGLVLLKY